MELVELVELSNRQIVESSNRQKVDGGVGGVVESSNR